MDEMRAMLDQLMGEDRNLNLDEKAKFKPRKRSYSDRDVCKHYLVGFCPYEEFRRTKNDCGDCPALHDEGAKAEWDALDDRAKARTGYEADLLRWLDRLESDLRKRIDSNNARLKSAERPLFLHEDQAKLDAMTAQLKELLDRATQLGEEGDVDGAQAATEAAEQIKVQRTAFEAGAEARAGNNALKNLHQEVCTVSGLIINNDETRLRDHHQGRNYNAWKKLHEVREALTSLKKERLERAQAEGVGPGEPSGRGGDGHRAERRRSRSREEQDAYRWDNGRRDDRSRRPYPGDDERRYAGRDGEYDRRSRRYDDDRGARRYDNDRGARRFDDDRGARRYDDDRGARRYDDSGRSRDRRYRDDGRHRDYGADGQRRRERSPAPSSRMDRDGPREEGEVDATAA